MLNEIYLGSPPPLQNMALTTYGAKTYYDRFAGTFSSLYDNIDDPFGPPSAASFQLQERRLKELVHHCAHYVPHYQDLLKGKDWQRINADNLAEYFPKLTKKELVDAPDRFLSTHPNMVKNRVRIHTSGTSGTPLNIYSSLEARKINYRFFSTALHALGVSYRTKSTTLAGRLLFKGESKRPDRYDRFNRTQYLSTYSIAERTIASYIDALNAWNPEYIEAHPSALFQLQYLARKFGLRFNGDLRFILTSSETLTDHVKQSVETFFNTKIIDHYGCAEMTVSAFSDGGLYYANPSYSVLELERTSDEGHSLICTGLLNFAMPLIRYDMGDSVTTDDSNNPYIFESVLGRKDDVIITPEGKYVGRMSPAFKGLDGLEAAQIIQETLTGLTVKVVVNKEHMSAFNERKLVDKIKERTSHSMNVTVVYQDDIQKERNGKFRSVINKIYKDYREGQTPSPS